MQDTYPTTPPPPQAKSNTTLVIVALGLGLLVALISALYTTSIRKEVQAQMRPVWRLTRDKEIGDKFNFKRDLKPAQLPVEVIEEMGDLFDNLESLENKDGELFKRPARASEYMEHTMFLGGGALQENEIDEENRAAAIQVNGRTAPAGLRPGMFVDILVTITPPGQLPETHVVMEKVKAIGVGASTDEGSGGSRSYSAITVEVKPEEALALTAISNSPQVSSQGFALLIRNPTAPPRMLGVNTKVLDVLRIKVPKTASNP